VNATVSKARFCRECRFDAPSRLSRYSSTFIIRTSSSGVNRAIGSGGCNDDAVPRRLRMKAAHHFIHHDAHFRAHMPRLGPKGMNRKALRTSRRKDTDQSARAQMIGDQPGREEGETTSG